MTDSVPEREGATAFAFGLRGLTFELTPTAEAGRLARVVQHKPARHAGKLACRSGSGAERGVRPHFFGSKLTSDAIRLFGLHMPGGGSPFVGQTSQHRYSVLRCTLFPIRALHDCVLLTRKTSFMRFGSATSSDGSDGQ
jgi:hypothetical protein